jgi:hypothetical protein
MATEEKIIKDAQFRKGASIAFFNSTNSAIAIVVEEIKLRGDPSVSEEHILTRINFYRDHFLEQHREYYSSVISPIGGNYKASDTIEKLKGTKNTGELYKLWLTLSEDERRDGEVLKVKDALKEEYETIR